LKATSKSIMRRSISYVWITSSSFSATKNVRSSDEEINIVDVITLGWVYVHNSAFFLGLLIDNYISNEMKFLGLQVRKSYTESNSNGSLDVLVTYKTLLVKLPCAIMTSGLQPIPVKIGSHTYNLYK